MSEPENPLPEPFFDATPIARLRRIMADTEPENPLVFPQDTERLGQDSFGGEVATFRRHGGMTLRDAAALAALQGIASRFTTEYLLTLAEGQVAGRPFIDAAFVLADTFMAARQQKKPAK